MGKRLMVVDDSPVLELEMRCLLEDSGFEIVACCQNGEEAIAQYDKVHPDVVTMDIVMPGIDGLETAQVILEDHPEANIVMVSSLVCDGSMNEADAIGAKAFVCKPFERNNLITALEKAVG